MSLLLKRAALWGPVALMLSVAAVSARQDKPQEKPLPISGAGAAPTYPVYSAWFAEHAKSAADAQMNYLSIGTNGGISQLTDLLVFFAATDKPMTDEEYREPPARSFTCRP